MKANLGFYIQKINDIVKETETVGETMNPHFEEVRTALDDKKAADLTKEQLATVKEQFTVGTEKYREMSEAIAKLKAPVRVIGIHKKMEKAYSEYVASCDLMVQSIDAESGTINEEQFNQSEEEQDETTDTIAFCIQRMTSLLMKK